MKLFSLIAFFYSFQSIGQNIDKPTYYLEERVGITNYYVVPTFDTSIVISETNKSYKQENPYYNFSFISSIIPFGENNSNLNKILKLRAYQLDMDTLNFLDKLQHLKNKYNQSIYFLHEEIWYYKGQELNHKTDITIDDSTLINTGYRYVAYVIPNNENIEESMFLTLDILPVYAQFTSNDGTIALKISGWDMLRSLHLNPKIYNKEKD